MVGAFVQLLRVRDRDRMQEGIHEKAFAALPAGTVDTLLEDPTGDLADILKYHVVEGDVMSTDLTDGMELTTVNGAKVTDGVLMPG